MTWRRARKKTQTKPRSKYGNCQHTTADGLKEDSKGQAGRHKVLEKMVEGGEISDLKRQVTFQLYGRGGNKICKIIPDWTYVEGGKLVAEDWKGIATADFVIKKKLFEDNYPEYEFKITGPYHKIMDKKRAKSRAAYAAKKASRKKI